jgi:hypothetical protein
MRPRLKEVLLVAILLTGCAGPTSYHPSTQGGGYRDHQLAADRYQIFYTANSLTRRSTTKQYLLYRAAEITLEANKENFVVLDQNGRRFSLPDYATGSEFYRHHDFEHHHLWFADQGVEEQISTTNLKPLARYTGDITIVLYSGDQPPEEGKVYNAREVIEVLGNTILRP